MTIHRHDEAITFVSWTPAGALHIRRPRSQKSVAYCGAPVIETRRLELVRDFTIEHPDEIPLEIRIERDFARLCSKCAKGFGDCVAEDYAGLEWVDVPDVWRAILARAHRPPVSVDLSKPHLMLNPTPSAADLEADKQRRQNWQLVRDSRIQHTTDELEDPTTEGDRRREAANEALDELWRLGLLDDPPAAEHDVEGGPR